jgi:hypothetical protein
MSRTTLTTITAAVLAALSLGVMITRHVVLGDEVKLPGGPPIWKVVMVVHGHSQAEPRLVTAAPLDLGHQHVLHEDFSSPELNHKGPETTQVDRRPVLWTRRVGEQGGAFRVRCEFHVAVDVTHPGGAALRTAHALSAAPQPGEHLELGEEKSGERETLSNKARELSANRERPADVAEALYRFVEKDILNDPPLNDRERSPAVCLHDGSGDSGAKARLLVVLLRHRGIPARLVTGLALAHSGAEQRFHYWVEAWVDNRWLPMCPFHRHYGRVPNTYVVFGHGDRPLVRGQQIKDLTCAFLAERTTAADLDGGSASPLKRFFRTTSLYLLPPPEQRLAELLLLLPVAALIICLYRNVIGLNSFGTFAPALVGLAFRDLHTLPGLLVFVSILMIGWVFRRVLDRYHLLQVPRIALMLSLIMAVLLLLMVVANYYDFPATRYVALFPLVILTGMVERFWTLETEDGTTSSFRTLLSTLFIAATIAVVLSIHAVVRHLFRCPETLGLIMACQLLIGRYTGYRLMELVRFRDLLKPRTPALLPETE